MADDRTRIIAEIADQVANGALPGDKCVGCGSGDAESLSLYAICERREERLSPTDKKRMLMAGSLLILSFVLGGLLVFLFVGAAILFRMLTKKQSLIIVGEDIFVPIPVSSCAQCKKATQGSTSENTLICLYQALYFLAACLLFAAFVLERLSWLWGAICCTVAVVLNLYVRYLEHRSPHGMKALVARVPEYAHLLAAYSKAEIWSELPAGVSGASPPAHQNDKAEPQR
jgi:hypothetical protein